ncbi:MAG: hypothetical protein OXC07_04620, partial [Kistimonas sp.]|nr:hypothetical protein [Kistimonas sp.]
DLSDMIPGLDVAALYVRSDIDAGAATPVAADASEYNLHVNYAVPALEGLKLSLAHGVYEVKASGVANSSNTQKDTRIIASYDLVAF